MYFSCLSFSSASVYFHLFHSHNHHLSPNSPRLMFLFVKCATVNKVYLILSYLILSPSTQNLVDPSCFCDQDNRRWPWNYAWLYDALFWHGVDFFLFDLSLTQGYSLLGDFLMGSVVPVLILCLMYGQDPKSFLSLANTWLYSISLFFSPSHSSLVSYSELSARSFCRCSGRSCASPAVAVTAAHAVSF